MNSIRLLGAAALSAGIAGCASTPTSVPQSTQSAPVATAPMIETIALPDRVASAPEQVIAAPQTIDLGAYDPAPAPAAAPQYTAAAPVPYETVAVQPSYTLQSPGFSEAARPLARGQMLPVRDDPYGGSLAPTARATTYNVAALKAAYHPSEALSAAAPPARVRNAHTPEFGRKLSNSALSRINPNVAYVASYKKIGYPWGDVPESTGVCSDVVIRTYRGLGIDLQSMMHEDMRRAFSAYPSKKIYGLTKPDPNIDHRRVVNMEAFFERVGAGIPVGSPTQPGDIITWRLSGGEPHIGVVVDQRDIKTGNYMIVHNLGAGVQVEDLLDYAPAHGHYRFAPDSQSRMASMALKRG